MNATEKVMRVNARLDEEAAGQVEYLVAATGEGVSHVLRESVAHYYRHVKAQKRGPSHFLAMVGKYLGEALEEKYGLAPVKPRRK